MKPAGIILAGGRARRMGGGDKTLLRFGGKTLLETIVEILAPQVACLALSANGDASRFADYGLPIFPDSIAGEIGPLAGILAGMEWCAHHRPHIADIVTVPGDAPFLPEDLVARLTATRRAAEVGVAIAESNGRRHPVVGLWPVGLAPSLRRVIADHGIRKVGRFAESIGAAAAVFPVRSVDPFTNVNTPADLVRAKLSIEAAQAPTAPA